MMLRISEHEFTSLDNYSEIKWDSESGHICFRTKKGGSHSFDDKDKVVWNRLLKATGQE